MIEFNIFLINAIRILGEGESIIEDLIKILIENIENRLIFFENPLQNEPNIDNRKKLLKLLFNLKPILIKEIDELKRSSIIKKQTSVLANILSKELNLQKKELSNKISENFKKEYEKKVPTSYLGLQKRFLES
ncbi:MAG: hypothetical protein ACFE9Z_08155 [Promethearchaeota archaeon]